MTLVKRNNDQLNYKDVTNIDCSDHIKAHIPALFEMNILKLNVSNGLKIITCI